MIYLRDLPNQCSFQKMVRDQMASSFSWRTRAFVGLIALLLSNLAAHANLDEVLDQSGFEFTNGTNAAKWKALQSAIEEDREVVASCRSDLANCPSSVALRFIAIVDEGMQYDDRVRIGHINRAANLAIRRTKKYVDQW